MKKMLAAAGIGAMLIATSAAAFADGAATDDAPRVVDRVSVDVISSDEVAALVKPGAPAPVATAGAYNSLISQATTAEVAQAKSDFFRCYPFGCADFGLPDYSGLWMTAAVVGAVVVATNDDSESD
jgi:hypothetical protein